MASSRLPGSGSAFRDPAILSSADSDWATVRSSRLTLREFGG